jgi:tRNA U34 5-carboxymethylaminomethyl modifying GTPase MnmE/TrmE
LIWLIDIDNGAITEDDIQFIKSLSIKTPILIVFTKADLKSDKEIKQIIEEAKDTVSQTNINCFGVTAYSANLQKEYGNNVIKQFLNYTVSGSVRNSDIIAEFKHVEKDMREAIIKAINQAKSTANGLFNYISESDKILEIRSLAMLWGKANQDGYELDKLLKSYDGLIREINIEINKYFREEESV